jgi:cobalt transporter subunit CbtB
MNAIATAKQAGVVQIVGLAERLPALLVMFFGLVIVYAVGFSPFTRAHNAAHDTRHANGFPCH